MADKSEVLKVIKAHPGIKQCDIGKYIDFKNNAALIRLLKKREIRREKHQSGGFAVYAIEKQ